MAAWAMGRGIHPSLLTLGNAVIGIGGSVAVFLAAGDGPFSAAVLAGVVLWQVAYVLDCADGQLARAAGRTSAAGARLDATADFVVQASMLVAVSEVVRDWSHPPAEFLVAFAATWSVNLFAFVLVKLTGHEGASLVRSTSRPAAIAKLSRDYGAQIALLGAWVLCSPRTVVVPVAGLTAVNSALLLAYLARDAQASLRSTPGVWLGDPGRRK
ncbi:MAG: CDP-alcohol phosphatidyltransferase family protein [Candidatus Dormibacteraceae bacterium]